MNDPSQMTSGALQTQNNVLTFMGCPREISSDEACDALKDLYYSKGLPCTDVVEHVQDIFGGSELITFCEFLNKFAVFR